MVQGNTDAHVFDSIPSTIWREIPHLISCLFALLQLQSWRRNRHPSHRLWSRQHPCICMGYWQSSCYAAWHWHGTLPCFNNIMNITCHTRHTEVSTCLRKVWTLRQDPSTLWRIFIFVMVETGAKPTTRNLIKRTFLIRDTGLLLLVGNSLRQWRHVELECKCASI